MTANVRLELTWPNKDKFLLAPQDENGKPVWVERDHPAAHEVRLTDFRGEVGEVNVRDPYADNLLFTGDSLDALRILNEVPEYRRHYRGKFKLIYIDPPFNTGQTFEHYDDWMEHSTWLSFMRDRLLLMRELLAPHGSIWVHLDDVEQHRMRLLMDEVFGEENFISTVVWRASDNSNNDTRTLSTDHNYIHVYTKTAGWSSNRLRPRPEQVSHYSNPTDDPRGPYFDGNPLNSPTYAETLRYQLETPSGNLIDPPPKGWRWSRETMQSKIDSGEIFFTANETGIKRRTYLADHRGLPASALWFNLDVTGHTRAAKAELKRLFPGMTALQLFDTPKPERFIAYILEIATQPGDLVLDCFGGSGTTAAVAQKMGRRWVTAEILAETVATFVRPRLEKVVAGDDSGGITETVGWRGGGGFRCVEVGPSMYEVDEDVVLLAPWATNGNFARAVAGQLGFEWQSSKHAPFCGVRGRMRLAVLDGAVGPEEVREIVAALGEGERVTIVAKVVLPETEEVLRNLSKGSRIRKAPRDLLVDSARKSRRGGAR